MDIVQCMAVRADSVCVHAPSTLGSDAVLSVLVVYHWSETVMQTVSSNRKY